MATNINDILSLANHVKSIQQSTFDYKQAIANILLLICREQYCEACVDSIEMQRINSVKNDIYDEPAVVSDSYHAAIFLSQLAFSGKCDDESLNSLRHVNAKLYNGLIKVKSEARNGRHVCAEFTKNYLYKTTDLHKYL